MKLFLSINREAEHGRPRMAVAGRGRRPSRRASCLSLGLLAWLLAGSLSAQTPAYRAIFGVLEFPPAGPINATTVENLGTINVFSLTSTTLFDTQNTLNFINRGTMNGGLGFQFDYLRGDTGLRYPAAGFTNQGVIFAGDDIVVNGTNIVNLPGGKMSAERAGRVRFASTYEPLDGPVTLVPGGTINLLSSQVRAGDSSESFNSSEGNLFPNDDEYTTPDNVVDGYWGGGGAGQHSISSLRSGFSARLGGGYAVTNSGFRGTISPSFVPLVDTNFPTSPGYSFYVYTNFTRITAGNVVPAVYRAVVQMVFVQTNLPNNPQVRVFFVPHVNNDNFQLRDAEVEFGTEQTDPLLNQTFTRYIRVIDRLATNASAAGISPIDFFLNVPRTLRADSRQSFRSDNYEVVRTDNPRASFEFPPSDYDPNVIWSPTTLLSTNVGARYQTNIVPHTYAAHQFGVRPRNVAGGGTGSDLYTGDAQTDQLNDPTNSPGRVELAADQVNLNLAAIRADNLLSIRATNLTSMEGATIDAQNIDFELLSPNGTVVLSNSFPGAVSRLNGAVSVWSAVWQIDQFVTNAVQFGITNIPGVPALTGTNTVEYTYHLMVVDLNQFTGDFGPLSTNQPVVFPRFHVNAANLEQHDTNTVTRSFFLGGTNWLIGTNGVVTLSGANTAFTAANAPRLNNFTNLGQLSIPIEGNFGADRRDASLNPAPYSNIVNRGSISSGSLQFAADNFENSNTVFSFSGAVGINAATNRLQGGIIFSAGRLDLSGRELIITASNEFLPVLYGIGKLNLGLTERLSDTGLTNVWYANDGFALNTRPLKGDLLATRVHSFADPGQKVIHFWAAEDRGDSPSGYANNAAVGELVLDGQTNCLFDFFPAPGQTNALYLDTLTLNNHATNFATALKVEPNFTIYFAHANVPGDKLTNAFPGRFVWVSAGTRAGPRVTVRTSMARTTSMTTQEYQELLASSPDVDGDGLPNELDETPFSGFTISNVRILDAPPNRMALISWQALPGASYTVEYRNGLDATVWNVLGIYTAASTTMSAVDVVPPGGQRFYRVRYGN